MANLSHKEENLIGKNLKLDEFDHKLINLLNKDARLTLRELAKEIALSQNSIKLRIDKLLQHKIIRFTALPLRLSTMGYTMTAHVYLKLHNVTVEKKDKLYYALKYNPRVIILMSMVGDYDLYFVLLTKGPKDLNHIKDTIRNNFSDLISDWKEVIVAEVLKYEEYEV